MENKKYSAVGRSAKNNRLGCSVCPKKIDSENIILNSSSNNLYFERRCLKHNEHEKSKLTSAFLSRAKVNECYCDQMEQIKTSIPKLICSKYLKIPNLNHVNEDWLNEIIEFRHENWFDCHSDMFIDTTSIRNINSPCMPNKHLMNCCHLNDSTLVHETEFNKLKTQNMHEKYLERPTAREKLEIVKKKTTEQKYTDKKKSISNTICKPWIPPSFSF